MKRLFLVLLLLISSTATASDVQVPGGKVVVATPIAGKGPDGGAVALNVDGNGNIVTGGGTNAPTFGPVLVLTTATKVPASSNLTRTGIFLQNLGPTDIWCAPSNTVTASNGIKVPAGGGTFNNPLPGSVDLYCIDPGGNQLGDANTRYLEN